MNWGMAAAMNLVGCWDSLDAERERTRQNRATRHSASRRVAALGSRFFSAITSS